ncbi:MAG: DUF1353 domain-containing protein [Pseudomonadota bacterium]
MSHWTGSLIIEHDISGGRQRVRPLQPLVWEIGYIGSGDLLIVEADGRWFDGLSIPRCLEWIAERTGRGLRAAITHDDLITQLREGRPDPRFPDRLSIDRLFEEQLKASGFGKLRRGVLYAGARIGAHFPSLARLAVYEP